jgi:EAL domain-containing protein (putative c-di-GMP-specific phosphodiesterase class I)/ActR/RegA family two-component response regulator
LSTLRPPRPEGRLRLLVVEDNPTMLKLFGTALSQTNDVVLTASGAEATEALYGLPFDAIITDIMLPDFDGIELLKIIRSSDLDVPVIIVTGHPSVETAARAMELGALRYLVKPVDVVALDSVVRQVTAMGRVARAKRQLHAILEPPQSAPSFLGDRAGLMVSYERALESLSLAFQPIFKTRTGQLVAYEALMRSSEETMPTPTAVLDAAERLGDLIELGRTIRGLAASALARLPPSIVLYVNVHVAELGDEHLYADASPLSEYAERVVLEITERATVESVRGLGERARRLRGLGFRLAVDDLGAGYAGLNTIAQLEPDVVKIDMGLVRNLHTAPMKRTVISSVMGLAREMGSRVVAEGVETGAERHALEELSVDLLQGYLLGRPGPLPTATRTDGE